MSHEPNDDHLTSGDGEGGDGSIDRGLLGDIYRHVRDHRNQNAQPNVAQQDQPHIINQLDEHSPSTHTSSGMSSLFSKMQDSVYQIGSGVKTKLTDDHQSSGHPSEEQPVVSDFASTHPFKSFAPKRIQNDIKWYVDGCGYMYAVSSALEKARESIWILDWWLSPELYLRRPPSKNEAYRVDRMLQAAAQRGVKVNIIVYKEVTQALTLSSNHTKHALEALNPNIAVFRHPDHLPDAKSYSAAFLSSLQKLRLNAASMSKLPSEAIKGLYGMNEDTVLYWAHHEKLCLVDGTIAFMGGLDLCYGRWDTNQHPIADSHPGDLNRIVYPGQDYNNARIMDFQDVCNPENNKLDRTMNSRMGWSDVSVCLSGPAVDDLKTHFVQRWNYIYNVKYSSRDEQRYSRLRTSPTGAAASNASEAIKQKMVGHLESKLEKLEAKDVAGAGHGRGHEMVEKLEGELEELESKHVAGEEGKHFGHDSPAKSPIQGGQTGGITCQIMRSCTEWSHNVPTEHSIQNAYCEVIKNSKHFVYIENQFFITATGNDQSPVKNQIGAAIVERILRAARTGEKYKMIVVIPAVPAFAGDLKADGALGTRAIMEFQYNSINRGGHSIMECIAKEGFDPLKYIRFYNLRNYDRLNTSATMRKAEQQSGVSYESARKEHDDLQGAGFGGQGEGTGAKPGRASAFDRYQQEAEKIQDNTGSASGRWDTVSECYMLGGEDIRNVPWEDGDIAEIDAFVSEELYVHTKLLIADDQVVICGSANLNDRSQLGLHDSEIAIFVEDQHFVDSRMNEEPWRASKFAASLRRQIFRKHLGLLRRQDMEAPDQNFQPIGVQNLYDWDSPEDQAVLDPLSEKFLNMWNWRAKSNTDAFAKVFHPVPYDGVQTWKQYDDYYEKFFHDDTKSAEKHNIYQWGHVVTEEFSTGETGLREVKDLLSTIKGNLVEMPLLFLKDEDIAVEGMSLNALTEEVYT